MTWEEFTKIIKEKYPKIKVNDFAVEFAYDLLYFSFYKKGGVFIQEYEEGVSIPDVSYEKMLLLIEGLYRE